MAAVHDDHLNWTQHIAGYLNQMLLLETWPINKDAKQLYEAEPYPITVILNIRLNSFQADDILWLIVLVSLPMLFLIINCFQFLPNDSVVISSLHYPIISDDLFLIILRVHIQCDSWLTLIKLQTKWCNLRDWLQ